MPREYKTYNDLEWKEHKLAVDAKRLDPQEFPILNESKDAKHATMLFDNGYGISVVKDCPLITMENKFECAVIGEVPADDSRQFRLVYDTDITGDVIRTDSEDEITDIMRRIQDLPPSNTKGCSKNELKCPLCGEKLQKRVRMTFGCPNECGLVTDNKKVFIAHEKALQVANAYRDLASMLAEGWINLLKVVVEDIDDISNASKARELINNLEQIQASIKKDAA